VSDGRAGRRVAAPQFLEQQQRKNAQMRKHAAWLAFCLTGAAALGAAPVAAADGPIKIGLIQPTSGPAAYNGKNTVDGAKLAEAEINAAGGVLGRQVELLVEDGKADPAESLNAAEKLLDRDKVSLLIGAWASSATLAVMPVVQRYEVPLIVETSTSEKITEAGNPWVFRISSNSKIDADALRPYLVKTLHLKKVAFMAANNDFGRAVVTNWSRVLAPEGGSVVAAEYHRPGETNFAPTLTKIKNSGADSIVITSDSRTLSNIVKQSYELGMGSLNRVVTSGFPAETIVELAGKDAAEGVLVQNYFAPHAPPQGKAEAYKAFADAYHKHYPSSTQGVDANVAAGYDAVRIAVAAIAQAKSAAPAKIRDALKTIKFDGLTGMLQFDAQGQARPFSSISRIVDGKPQVVVRVGQ
jgi:branched-chain amino acid transport system substrate-binding protein